MSYRDVIPECLTGRSTDKARRQELLEGLLDRFAAGGAEAVASDLESRLDVLERTFDGKLQALDGLLS